MIACYDLERCPPTYDAVAFLALLEQERLRRDHSGIDLHILPGPRGGFRQDTLWPHTVEAKVEARENILVPLCKLLPSVRSVEVRKDRNIEGWGKGEYLIGLRAIVRALEQGSRPLRGEQPGVSMQGYITFTLRESSHHPLRNSRTEEWVAAALELDKRGVVVFVIRDTARANELIPELEDRKVPIDTRLAATDLKTRAFVYANSTLNVGISNGPMWMSIFMNAPTLMLRPTTNKAQGCYDDRFFAQHGIARGGQLPTKPPHQRLEWEEDTRDNIIRAVEGMLEFVA